MLQGLLLTAITLGTAVLVVAAENPVYSLFALVGTALSAGLLHISVLGGFPTMILIAIYVGAIAIFFPFVVMMLDVRVETNSPKFFCAGAFSAGLAVMATCVVLANLAMPEIPTDKEILSCPEQAANVPTKLSTLYTSFGLYVGVAGILLFVAPIGTITILAGLRPTGRGHLVGGAPLLYWEPICWDVDPLSTSTAVSAVEPGLGFLLGLSLSGIGLYGIASRRTSVIYILLAFEVLTLGISLCFLAVAASSQDPAGFIYTMLLLTLSAVEAALFLSLAVQLHAFHGMTTLRPPGQASGV